MHELGIVFHIINEIEDVGEENELKTVSSVTVEIGEVSGGSTIILRIVGNGLAQRVSL